MWGEGEAYGFVALATKALSSRALRRSFAADASLLDCSPSQACKAGETPKFPRVSLVPNNRCMSSSRPDAPLELSPD